VLVEVPASISIPGTCTFTSTSTVTCKSPSSRVCVTVSLIDYSPTLHHLPRIVKSPLLRPATQRSYDVVPRASPDFRELLTLSSESRELS
jgi:hypothetical protein